MPKQILTYKQKKNAHARDESDETHGQKKIKKKYISLNKTTPFLPWHQGLHTHCYPAEADKDPKKQECF